MGNHLMKKLYLIDYESAHWCGGQLNVVVWANDEDDDAREVAEYHMEEEQRELFSDEFSEEDAVDFDSEQAYTVNSVELFDETHDQWVFYQDPTQESFYPVVGSPD
jgi:hypothetical protein